MLPSVGFIGVGKMGGPMAAHLSRAGARLSVFDLDRAAAERVGASVADGPEAVAKASEVVILMLPPPAVPEVVRALLPAMKPGGIVVDGGNSNPASSRALAAECLARGVHMLDVGMSGGPSGAAAGRLAVMAGGDREAYDRCVPLFRTFGRELAYLGPSGSGHLAKMVNNTIVAINWAVVAETLTLAEALGLDMASLTRVISTGAARSWALEQATRLYDEPLPGEPPRPSAQPARRPPGQLAWAIEHALELGVPVPIAGLVHELQKLSQLPDPPPTQALLRKIVWRSAGVPEQPDPRP